VAVHRGRAGTQRSAPWVRDRQAYDLSGLGIETVGDPYDFYRVAKLAYAKKQVDRKSVDDKSVILCNSRITLGGIPEEAYRYMYWMIECWQVTTDKASGIVNDPNDWSREVGEPRYRPRRSRGAGTTCGMPACPRG
jgi:predicted helicase